MEITKKKFEKPETFDINQYYKYCFGIINSDKTQPKEVILSFTPVQGKYIKTLPLHESQEILIDNDEELRIKLTLFLTHDFYMELLSYGDNLKVIQPQELINDIKTAFKNALELYK